MSEFLTARTRTAFDPRIDPLGVVRDPTIGAGAIADAIGRQLRRIGANKSPTLAEGGIGRGVTSVPERLHEALGAAKALLSQVSMHLDEQWRDKLFRQLDTLLDADSWDEADEVLGGSSFATFLRMVVYLRVAVRPALGISQRGHLLADWTVNGDSLTVEFLPDDEVRWVVSQTIDGDRENAAGKAYLGRLGSVLAPYNPARWLIDADKSKP